MRVESVDADSTFKLSRSAWEIHGKDTDTVGANMAEFAIGSLSTMAWKNPRITVNCSVPYLGSRIYVSWPYLIALLACISGVHFALFASAIYTSRLVVIKDDSNLSTARLLRPMAEDLGHSGTVLKGKELSQVITRREGKGGVVYGPRNVEGWPNYYLDIGNSVPPRTKWKDRRHPDGVYL
jgi:hypothetical protein